MASLQNHFVSGQLGDPGGAGRQRRRTAMPPLHVQSRSLLHPPPPPSTLQPAVQGGTHSSTARFVCFHCFVRTIHWRKAGNAQTHGGGGGDRTCRKNRGILGLVIKGVSTKTTILARSYWFVFYVFYGQGNDIHVMLHHTTPQQVHYS
jgi:hypothetical protein